jgi:hypothetical protein
MSQRFYSDEEGGEWYVFDSSVTPHKALSSWMCSQDAEDDAARLNELESSKIKCVE